MEMKRLVRSVVVIGGLVGTTFPVMILLGASVAKSQAVSGLPASTKEITFVKQLQRAVKNRDQTWVADHILYPLTVSIDGKPAVIKTRKAFLENYDAIINRDVKWAILNQDLDNIFKSSEGIMLGNGEVWIKSLSPKPGGPFTLYIVTINNDL